MDAILGTIVTNGILRDPEWTRRVVLAAVMANQALHRPEGDDPVLAARTILRTALIDEADLKAKLEAPHEAQ